MSTPKQKAVAFQITRLIIFLLGALAIILDAPLGDILGVISLGLWLWMPKLISLELKLLDKWRK